MLCIKPYLAWLGAIRVRNMKSRSRRKGCRVQVLKRNKTVLFITVTMKLFPISLWDPTEAEQCYSTSGRCKEHCKALPMISVPFLHPWKLQPCQTKKCNLPRPFSPAFPFSCSLSETLNHKPYNKKMLYVLWLWNCCSESWGGLDQNFWVLSTRHSFQPTSGSTAAAGSVLVWFAAGVCSAAPLPSMGWDSPGTAEETGFSQTHPINSHTTSPESYPHTWVRNKHVGRNGHWCQGGKQVWWCRNSTTCLGSSWVQDIHITGSASS